MSTPAVSLRDQLGLYVAQSMQEMMASSEKARNENSRTEGIWYPQDYAKVLLETKETKRYEWMRDHGHLLSGWAPPKFFEHVSDTVRGKKQLRDWTFIVKKEVLPSDALKAVKTGLSLLACGTVCQIARYDALLKMLGADKFNRLFSEPHGMRMNIGWKDDELQPMRFFVDFTASAKKQLPGTVNKRMVKVGEVVGFGGVPEYRIKHPIGMGGNFNLVCINDKINQQLFSGHGLPSKGATEEEVARLMVSEYNQTPDHLTRTPKERLEATTAILSVRNSDTKKNHAVPENDPLKQVTGFDHGSPQDFSIPLIEDLVRLPLEKISMDYVMKHPAVNKTAPVMDQGALVAMLQNMFDSAGQK